MREIGLQNLQASRLPPHKISYTIGLDLHESKGAFNNYVDKKRGGGGSQKSTRVNPRGGEGSAKSPRGPKFEKKIQLFQKVLQTIVH